MMKVLIRLNNPISIEEWNDLASRNGNLLCSTYYDCTQAYYKLYPIYFHFFVNESLVAGVKLYQWSNNKLSFISKQIMQFGEFIIDSDYAELDELKSFMNKAVADYILQGGYISFQVSSYYGNKHLLLTPFSEFKKKEYCVSYIDLTNESIDLKSTYKSSHKSSISRAKRENLCFELNNNVEVLIDLLAETYKDQPLEGPSPDFIRNFFESLVDSKLASIFVVRDKEQYLCAALVLEYGGVADYAFGGTLRNSKGAGQFLQHSIAEYYKQRNFSLYSLGQTAKSLDNANMKFTDGITKFKRGFGTVDLETFSYLYIMKRMKYNIYHFILNIYKKCI